MSATNRILDTNDRASEVLFGLIMVLTFTGTLSVVESGRDDVRAMLIGALGCNIAWGIIDGLFFLMACLAEKGQALKSYQAARRSTDPNEAQELLRSELPEVVASVLTKDELLSIHQKLLKQPEPATRVRLSGKEWLGALGVFLLVFISTFPVAIPFMFVEHVGQAMRISNGIAIAMLFVTGYVWGTQFARRPWLMGGLMVLLGVVLVAMTIALGG